MDSLLKKEKGFSLVELLVVIAVLVILMGTAALTLGTSMRNSRVRKAAFLFKSMLADGLKEAMTNYKQVIIEVDSSVGGGTRLRMYLDGDASFSYGSANDKLLAYFVLTGDKVDPGKPTGFTGNYYFIPDVVFSDTTQSGGNTLDLTSIYGTGFGSVQIVSSTAQIVIRPEGVFVVRVGGTSISPGGLVLFRHSDDIDEGNEDRQYFVLITKTFTRVLKLEDDGTGNFVPKELQ